MTLPRFAVIQCGSMDKEHHCCRKLRLRHYNLWLFLKVALSHTPPLRAIEVHINGITCITIHITESKIHISYSETMIRHYSSIIFTCHSFQPSPIPLLRCSTFSISSPFDVTKLQQKKVLMSHRLAAFCSQCQWTRIFISLTTPVATGTQL